MIKSKAATVDIAGTMALQYKRPSSPKVFYIDDGMAREPVPRSGGFDCDEHAQMLALSV
jgi:hypothetical protein